MNMEELLIKLQECLKEADKDEKSGKKHKGLLLIKSNNKEAISYIQKAKREMELFDFYKEKGFDYKLPEEWFYTLYYCGLSILSKLGVESRSQRYTALLLLYLKEKNIIEYDKEFIDRITVHQEKDRKSEVDKREEARYSSAIKIEKIREIYDEMVNLCKKAISQAEEIVYSNKVFDIPKELTNW